jgi:hypothetical protein
VQEATFSQPSARLLNHTHPNAACRLVYNLTLPSRAYHAGSGFDSSSTRLLVWSFYFERRARFAEEFVLHLNGATIRVWGIPAPDAWAVRLSEVRVFCVCGSFCDIFKDHGGWICFRGFCLRWDRRW